MNESMVQLPENWLQTIVRGAVKMIIQAPYGFGRNALDAIVPPPYQLTIREQNVYGKGNAESFHFVEAIIVQKDEVIAKANAGSFHHDRTRLYETEEILRKYLDYGVFRELVRFRLGDGFKGKVLLRRENGLQIYRVVSSQIFSFDWGYRFQVDRHFIKGRLVKTIIKRLEDEKVKPTNFWEVL